MRQEEFDLRWQAMQPAVRFILDNSKGRFADARDALCALLEMSNINGTRFLGEPDTLWGAGTDEVCAVLYHLLKRDNLPKILHAATVELAMPLVRVNAPHWYQDPGFVRWLVSGKAATWHANTTPTSDSDVFFTFCCCEGSDYSPDDSMIPKRIWHEVCAIALEQGHEECLFWVSNLER